MSAAYAASLALLALAYPAALAAERLHALGASARATGRSCTILLALALALPGLARLLPSSLSFDPPARIWSASSMSASHRAAPAVAQTAISFGGSPARPLPRSEQALRALAGLAVLLALARLARLARDALRLRALLSRAYVIRHVGRVRVAVSEEATTPFSVLAASAAWVVLPSAWTAQGPRAWRLATAHELEHHRQRHTAGAWAIELFRCAFAIHPLAPAWARLLARLQEFSCDETLIGHRGFSAREYGRCLYEAAQSASLSERMPAGATGMACGERGFNLKGRIRMLSRYEDRMSLRGPRGFTAALAVLTLAFAGAAWLAQASVGDSRVTMAKAREWARKAQAGTDFPIAVNEQVLEQLNRYVGTPDGRDFTRAALVRMHAFQPMLDEKLRENEVPRELLAVGMVESGFRNLPAQANPVRAAGVWQFIASTARTYGMRVNDKVDQRNDVPLETAAAFRYLKHGRDHFDDWLLGIMAYNAGEQKVERLIRDEATRDPWELAEAGAEFDQGYLARVMAMVLILKNEAAALN